MEAAAAAGFLGASSDADVLAGGTAGVHALIIRRRAWPPTAGGQLVPGPSAVLAAVREGL